MSISGGPDGGVGTDGSTAKWPSVEITQFLPVYELLPKGVVVAKDGSGNTGALFAKNDDGSLIVAELEYDSGATAYKYASKWEIWHADMYYKVEDSVFTSKAGVKSDRFITGNLKTPGGKVTSPKTLVLNTPYGGSTTASVSDMTPLISALPFLYFVNDSQNASAVFEKDDVVAGISCKKYVYQTSTPLTVKKEWWILENGFCLKHTSTLNGTLNVAFEVSQAELNTPSYDYVTQKYAKFKDQVGSVPAVGSMLKVADAVSGGAWIPADPSSDFLPWSAGGIGLMVAFRALDVTGNPYHQVFFSFPAGTDKAADLAQYKTQILQIPKMRELKDKSIATDVVSYWEYDNNVDVACGGYYLIFGVTTYGPGAGSPSNPAMISIRQITKICV